jgi:FkbM family methyltransferase
MVAAYGKHQDGKPIREVVWNYLHGFREFSLLSRTRHGWMTYSNKDLAIGRRLFLEGQFEYGLIARVIALLRDQGLRSGGLLVDVGANIGTVTLTLLRERAFRNAIPVEPIPGNYRRLLRNLWLNGLRHRARPIQAAAGSKSGMVRMTLSPTNHGDHRMRPSVSLGPEQMMESTWPSVDVRCDRLDDIVGERPDLLWMDVQGFELRVLEGAPRMLAAGVPVVMEFAPYWIAQAGIDADEFCEFFSSRFGTFFDLGRPVPVRMRAREIATLFSRYSGLAYSDLLALPP